MIRLVKSFWSRLASQGQEQHSGPELQRIQAALEYRLQFEKLIATISTQFISLTVDKIDQGIEESFREIGEFAGVDRGYIFWYSNILGRHMEQIHEWCGKGIPSQLDRVRQLNMGMFPYFDRKIKLLEPFYTDRVADLPPGAESEKKEFSAEGVKSLLFVPMIFNGEATGFVGFETLRKERSWSEDTITLLKMASEIYVNALERKRADKILRQSEERYALIARGVNDGLWDWNMKTNKIFYSSRWKSMLGHQEDEIMDTQEAWFDRVHPDDLRSVKRKLRDHLEGKTVHFESEHRMRHKDGGYRWMLTRGLAVTDEKGRIWRIAGSQTDITDRKKFEEQLEHNALHDTLTGLPNRALFMDRLKAAVTRSKTNSAYMFAVLFLDLDRFKTVNDSYGHLFGDQMLIQVGERVHSCLGQADTAARFGGDEFTILLEDIHKPLYAIRVAEQIQKALQDPFILNEQTVLTSASIGIALGSSEDASCEEDLLRNADTAMYRAKVITRGHHVVYNENMHAQVVQMLKLETDLRRASEASHFQLHYQPILSLQSGQIEGFEALIRWAHPERGAIPPSVFIPLAEETGLIIPIGLWVLREACREAQNWKNGSSPLTLSVNLSARQLTQTDLIPQIEKILKETKIAPERLCLEITESAFVENPDQAAGILARIRDLKIKLHLDDFGTGYSSLSYLHKFQLDALKIDRSFICNIGSRGENSEIAKTIVALAHNMGMEVVAEGIETPEQRECLRGLGCEYGQGFLFSKPLEREAVSSFVMNH